MDKPVKTVTDRPARQVTILAHNLGQIRDMWLDTDPKTGEKWLVIRQVNFDVTDGSNGVVNKQFRFNMEECAAIKRLIEEGE